MTHQERMADLRARLIVGTQYYRPPTPLPEDWEDDFKRMRDIGLTLVKFWVYWRWVEYRQGRFEFGDYDRLFELGATHGIRLQPNLFVESAPQWVYNAYPDCLPVTMQRDIVRPHDRISTQIGGYMPCFDHDAVRKLAIRFIRQVVERYKDHPALACWDIWNEINLKAPDDVCACPASTARYQLWLERRYDDIAALNREWQMRYAAFAEVLPPVNKMNYASYLHWRLFGAENVAWHGAWRAGAIREVDAAQVVMVHFGGCPGVWSYIGNAPSLRGARAGVDFLGVSGHNFPGMRHADHYKNNLALEANYKMLCTLEDYAWASEVSSDATVMGEFYPAPQLPKEYIAYWTLLPIALGCKAVLYWSFKPERLGGEAPGLGLIKLDGVYTPRAHEVKRIVEFLRAEPEFFAQARPRPADIGILHDDEAALMASVAYESGPHPQNYKVYMESLRGAYLAFQRLHLPVRYVLADELAACRLKVLYIPFMVLARRAWLAPLREFVTNGGTLIAEGGLGQYREGDYFYEKTIPGAGLHELFGVKETGAVHEVYMHQDSGKKTAAVAAGMHGDVLEPSGPAAFLDFNEEMPIRWNTGEFMGHFEKRPLQLDTAQPLAWFKDGAVAASVRQIGQGRAIYIGTVPSLGVWRTESNYPAFLQFLIEVPSPYTEVLAAIPERVTVESLEYRGRRLWFVFSHTRAVVKLKLQGDVALKYAANPDTDRLNEGRLQLSPLSVVVLEPAATGAVHPGGILP